MLIPGCPFGIVSIGDRVHWGRCPFGTVPIWDSKHLGRCPYGMVSVRNGLRSGWCPLGMVSNRDDANRDGVHSGWCPFGMVPIWDRARSGSCAGFDAFDSKNLTIHLPDGKYYWTFVVASVAQPLLRADFLCAYSLLLNVRHYRLVDTQLFTSIPI